MRYKDAMALLQVPIQAACLVFYIVEYGFLKGILSLPSTSTRHIYGSNANLYF